MSTGPNAVDIPSSFTFIYKSGAKFRVSASVTVTVFCFGPIALSLR